MTEKLTVEKLKDGTYRRSDGVVLQPAEKNPYYVLATVHGEYLDENNMELTAKNRRIWNGWACAGMEPDARAKLAEEIKLEPDALDPLTPEETALVKAAFKDRLGDGVKVPEVRSVDLSKTHFSHTVVWEKCVFAGDAGFPSAHFAGDAWFPSAHFAGRAEFPSAHFAGDAGFPSAHFAGPAEFPSAHFAGPAEFSSAHFAGDAWFASAHFAGYAAFPSAHFAGDAAFPSAHFAGYAWFPSAHFAGPAWFPSAHFAGRAEFASAHFAGDAWFPSAHFAGGAWFSSAHFAGDAEFSNGAFEAPTDFRRAEFHGRVPVFHQRRFHDDTNFTQVVTAKDGTRYWPEVSQDKDGAQDDKNAYRRLRQVSSGQHNPEAEHFFLRQEMACDAVLKEDFLSRLIVRAFGWVSDYGYSVWRPVLALLGAWGGGALLMQMVFAWHYIFRKPFEGTEHIPGFAEALWLGLANTFAIFGFRTFYFGETYMSTLPGFVKFVGGTQTILGFVFLFFLGLGLRNRFRLK